MRARSEQGWSLIRKKIYWMMVRKKGVERFYMLRW
jgi:hypothetical protein